MMDVTVLFNEYLAAKGASPILLQEPYEISRLNGFMRDAYRINDLLNDLVRYLRVIRSRYLVLDVHRNRSRLNGGRRKDQDRPFTDQERTDIDNAMKTQLTQIDKGIQNLSSAAELDREVRQKLREKKEARRGFGRLGKWAAGGAPAEKSPADLEEDAKLETEKAYRDGVVLSLRMRLQQAGRVQEGIVSARLNREIERSQNILSKARSSRFQAEFPSESASLQQRGTLSAVDLDYEAEQSSRAQRETLRHSLESKMSPSQLQQLQAEESTMLKHYNAELEKIQQAQKSVLEIGELQTELTMQLNLQAEGISQLVSDSLEIGGNVKEGNKQLEKAKERFRPAQWAFYTAVGTGCVLVAWDLIF